MTCLQCAHPIHAKQLCKSHYVYESAKRKLRTRCHECGEIQRCYRNRCLNCHAYAKRTGRPRGTRRNFPRPTYFCIICLAHFQAPHRKSKLCSRACRGLLIHLRSYRGRIALCQRCRHWKRIRSKKLCASCYVMSRLMLNQNGIFGRCASRLNRLTEQAIL